MGNSGRAHVEQLGQHGAYVMTATGRERLDGAFYDRIVQFCEQYKIGCMAYEMHIPETDESMQLAIWRNGHVDSGCADHIRAVMDR